MITQQHVHRIEYRRYFLYTNIHKTKEQLHTFQQFSRDKSVETVEIRDDSIQKQIINLE